MNCKKIFTNPVGIVVIAVICNIMWGSAFPFIKIGYQLFGITDKVSDKMLFAGERFFLSGILLLLTYLLINRRFPKPAKENVLAVAGLGLIQTTLQYLFFYVGVSNTTSANGSIVNSTSVFFSVILAHFIYVDDKMNLQKMVGCILGFCGVFMITIGDGSAGFAWNGEGLIMVAACSSAIGSIITKKLTKKEDSWVITAYNLAFGGFILILLGKGSGGSLTQASGKGILVLLYLAMLSAVTFTLWAMLLQYNNVSQICIYNFVIPVAGTILSAIMLKENVFKPSYLVSLVLLCGGIYIVNHSQFKMFQKKQKCSYK